MKKTTRYFHSILLLSTLFVSSAPLYAQKDFKHDTAYYETYPEKINFRIYLSQKYIHLNFPATASGSELEYKANPKLNLGAGFTTKGISVNLFSGFGFLNTNKVDKGKTKGLDLQIHLFPHKWAVDLYVEVPKGFHLEPKGLAGATADKYYYRKDIKSNFFGISAYRVPNKEKFSYKAALLQTEWQKKSAGSFLYGGEIYYGSIKGDSALVPHLLQNGFPQAGITKFNYLSFGPGVGYAYTLVLAKHLFLTGSAVANLDVNISTEEGIKKENKISINPAEVFKAAAGYNSSTWNVSANWTGNGLWIQGASSSKDYFLPSGNVRIVVARKFNKHKHSI